MIIKWRIVDGRGETLGSEERCVQVLDEDLAGLSSHEATLRIVDAVRGAFMSAVDSLDYRCTIIPAELAAATKGSHE